MHSHLKSRRQVVVASAVMAAGALLSQAVPRALYAQPTPLRKRRNIEALTEAELKAYEEAMQIVKDRSAANPADKTGYRYWADLHNDFDTTHSGCAHFSEKFLPWHRRHLFDFEDVLRKTKPGVTDNLMIPYWDWTKLSQEGTRFPKAFTREGSPLFDRRFANTPPPWDADDVMSIVRNPDWADFAGQPDPSDGFGEAPGSLESGPHNTLHGNISRNMRSPSTAALDPIFWSFHAYIDVVWTRWQRLHVTTGTAQSFNDGAAKIWFLDRSFDVSSTAKTADFTYEYEYDYAPDGPPAGPMPLGLPPAVSVYSAPKRVVALNLVRETGRYLVLRPAGQVTTPQSAALRIGDAPAFRDRTYRLEVYLHPENIDVSSINPEARRPLAVRMFTIWRAHHDTKVKLFAKLSPTQVARLNQGWQISIASQVVLTGEDPGDLATPNPAFTLPVTSALVRQVEVQER